jgi:hypothetical protein
VPFKNKDDKLAYQRKWYAAHRQRVIKKVHDRKWGLYGGTCKNCGAPTMGESKGKTSEYCGKPDCKSAQHRANKEVFSEAGRKISVALRVKRQEKMWTYQEHPVVSIDELMDEM